MVASAVACYHVGESTKSAIAPKGRCNNVLLEDVMADFTRAFKRHLAVPLNIPADSIHTLGASFAQKCDPSLGKSRSHSTNHHGREQAVQLIREIDKRYLDGAMDGALHRAEETLRRLLP